MSNNAMDYLPMGVVLHVPHHSTLIPLSLRDQFLLEPSELNREVVRMTDHLTLPLFAGESLSEQIVVAPVSRLVVDVERFPEDGDEPMSARGMGVIYTATADGFPLRRQMSHEERQILLADYYVPHHARLSAAVCTSLERNGQCLIIDAHSFPSQPLLYEDDQEADRPDICIGTDKHHTPERVRAAFKMSFVNEGFSVLENRPFSGAVVPAPYFGSDRRVMSVMVEVNRGLYLDEMTGLANCEFESVSRRVRRACRIAIDLSLGKDDK